MERKLNKIVGITKQEFDNHIKFKQIYCSPARLIPTSKPGDEISLTSVLLRSLCMVKEFRKQFLGDVGMTNTGKIHVYTEVCFPHLSDSKDRPDGLILIEKNGTIVDAALMEMKKGSNELKLEQVERYASIAKELAIPKLITVSNQFVSEPTQNPLALKSTKALSFFHLSWPYIRTVAHILLNNEDNTIDDHDQRAIMTEVLEYFESDKCEINDSHQMKDGWTNVINKIYSRESFQETEVREAVQSWHQEEMDLALKLSKNLGIIVSGGESKYKENYQKRMDDDSKSLTSTNMLASSLKIKGAASKVYLNAFLDKRTIEMFVELKAPADKKSKGQMSWLEKQLRDCNKKDEAGFSSLKTSLFIDIYFKSVSKPERVSLEKFLTSYESDKEIREFGITFLKDFGKDFGHKTKFVEGLEKMSLDFYGRIVEHLKAYEAPAPKLSETIIQNVNQVPVSTTLEETATVDSVASIIEPSENVA